MSGTILSGRKKSAPVVTITVLRPVPQFLTSQEPLCYCSLCQMVGGAWPEWNNHVILMWSHYGYFTVSKQIGATGDRVGVVRSSSVTECLLIFVLFQTRVHEANS